MQQFSNYFGNYDGATQQSQQPASLSQDQQATQPQQQPLGMNGSNLAIYSSATMPSLSVLTATQAKHDPQQQGLSGSVDLGAHGKPKRKQVKNACVNCQKACKKCDDGRPCQRCIKYGITDTCINSVRKQRKKGIKRGPYKKRNKSGESNSVTSSGASTPNVVSPLTNANLYNGARANPTNNNTMPIHYQPFTSQATYDPYGSTYGSQMMPQAYMVPGAIPQIYPNNPSVLSYQPAVNLIPPQQQQQQQQPSNNTNFVPQDLPSPSLNAPTSSTVSNVGTPTTTDEKTIKTDQEEDDDEKSKLTILSQLCSAVLDSNGNPKKEENEQTSQEENVSGNSEQV